MENIINFFVRRLRRLGRSRCVRVFICTPTGGAEDKYLAQAKTNDLAGTSTLRVPSYVSKTQYVSTLPNNSVQNPTSRVSAPPFPNDAHSPVPARVRSISARDEINEPTERGGSQGGGRAAA